VFRVFGENTERLRGVLLDAVVALPAEPTGCECGPPVEG
jgi:5'-methylthioadenosine phosphorylase